MRKVFLALLVLGCVAVGALSWVTLRGGSVDVRPPEVEVDTPALREAKARAGIEDCAPGAGDAAVPDGLPDLTLPCLGGGPDVDLSSLRGPMLVNFWASWCGPCEEEMPALEEFHQQYGDQVAVVGVDVNDVKPELALALADRTGATYPLLVDVGGSVFEHEVLNFVSRGLPAFVYVDADGTVVGSSSGGVDSVDEIKANVADKLGIRL